MSPLTSLDFIYQLWHVRRWPRLQSSRQIRICYGASSPQTAWRSLRGVGCCMGERVQRVSVGTATGAYLTKLLKGMRPRQNFMTCPLRGRCFYSPRRTLAAAPRPGIGPNQSGPRAHYSLANQDCMHVSMQYEYIYCNFEDLYMYLQLPTFFALSSCN